MIIVSIITIIQIQLIPNCSSQTKEPAWQLTNRTPILMITIIIIINIARVLACVTCRRVVFRKKPTCIDSGMVFQITYIHYYTAKFAHMNGHWKAYDYFTLFTVVLLFYCCHFEMCFIRIPNTYVQSHNHIHPMGQTWFFQTQYLSNIFFCIKKYMSGRMSPRWNSSGTQY